MLDLRQFDLTKLADQGRTLQLKHPVTGEPFFGADGTSPVTLTGMGFDSTVAQQRVRDRLDRLRDMEDDDRRRRTTADLEAERIEDLVMLTTSWAEIGLDGALLPFSHANARKVFTEIGWVREQWAEFLGSRADFFGGSLPGSRNGTAASASATPPASASAGS